MNGRAMGVLLGAVLVVFTAQQLLTPILAPLSREVGLSEVQLGLVMTAAAVVFSLGSLGWGRVADRWGPRRVLLTGLLTCLVGLVTFWLVCTWALAGERPSGLVLAAMVLTRSLLFGVGVGAVPVAALAAVGSATTGEEQRTKAVSMVGAAQAVAMVLGPGAGGALAVVDLLAPVWLAPVILLVAVLAVAALVPRPPVGGAAPRPGPAVRPWDARVRSFLVVGFLLFLSLGLLNVVIGFLMQDRLGLDAQDTAATVGAAFFAVGLVLVAVQAVAVPKLRWRPARLLRTGAPIAVVGFVLLALAPSFWTITAGMVVIALGLGLAMPGYTAGASLGVGRAEQGSVAGLVNAVTGATFVVGPLLGTALYAVAPALPIWLGGASCLLGAAVAWVSKGVGAPRVVEPVPDPAPPTG